MPDINNNPAATATAASGGSPFTLAEPSQSPTTTGQIGWCVSHSIFRNSNAQPSRLNESIVSSLGGGGGPVASGVTEIF